MSAQDHESANSSLSLIHRPSTDLVRLDHQSIRVARRAFLLTSMIGAAGLAVTPLHLALAQNTNSNDNCPTDPKPKKKGFWATFLFFLEIAATVFGFGALFRTVASIVNSVHSNYRQIAQDTLRGTLADLSTNRFQFHINNAPTSIATYSPLGFVPIKRDFAADARGFLQALRNDKFNGIMSYFDFNDANTARAATGQISAPATSAIVSCAIRKVLAQYGYTLPQYMDAIVFPKRQTTASMGDFNSQQEQCDKYVTPAGVTIDICYKNRFDNKTGGRTEGEITVHGLEAKNWSNKRLGIRRINFELNPAPILDQDFGTNYTKLDRPIVT